jgi:ABC-type multidrug transport system ATPase subunit
LSGIGEIVSPGLLLRAVGVSKVLGGVRVLRGVEATFGSGGVQVLEGPNGSGKSTLLSVLGGRIRATSGRALLQRGDQLVAEGPALRRTVGWLGHELGLYGDLDAFTNVALHAELRGLEAGPAWDSVAERLAIEPLRARRVRDLSRGQRQRVALGRALVGSPSVLLLDEPSTGLDTPAVERLAGLLRSVNESGTVVLTVTHDPAFADAVGGRRWQLRDGKVEPRSAS